MKKILSAFAAACILMAGPAFANKDATNSKRNDRIENNGELNAQDQGSSESDVALTSKIRRNVLKRKNLSMNAQNVKIISLNGSVTLKGPVKSMQEKSLIEKIAINAAGAENVSNQIEVQ